MRSALFLEEYDPEFRRSRRKSFALTVGIGVAIVLISWLVVAMKGTIPPEGQLELFAVGQGDFGNLTEGSEDRNSFQAPSPTNAPDEPSGAKPPKGDPATRDRDVPIAVRNRILTGNDEDVEPVRQTQPPKYPAKPSDKPTPPKPVTTKPATTQTQTGTGSGQNDNNQPVPPGTPPGGGANDGQGTDVGDFGGMNVPQDGTVEFGDGKFGLNGRRLREFVRPDYRPNRDEKVDFIVTVAPDGSVTNVVASVGNPTLIQDGIKALRQWKFSRIKTDQQQKIKVTLTFKQK